MTFAPLAAAARTSSFALATFFGASQEQANCVAARVTFLICASYHPPLEGGSKNSSAAKNFSGRGRDGAKAPPRNLRAANFDPPSRGGLNDGVRSCRFLLRDAMDAAAALDDVERVDLQDI